MPNSTANRAAVRYIKEITWGTTPATPAMKLLRMTGESLNANFKTVKSQEIRDDRNTMELIKIGSDAGGSVEFELSYTAFDDILEAAMCSTWIVDGVDTDQFTIVNGILDQSFTIQKAFLDVSQYFVFRGARINTLSLKYAPNAVITGSIGFMAQNCVRAAIGLTGATYPAGSTTTPMDGAAGVSVNLLDGAAITAGLMSFSVDINNNYRSQDAIGTDSAIAIVQGEFEATGDLEMYFADGTMYDKFATQQTFSARVTSSKPASTDITVDVPKAKFESVEIVAQGTNSDVMFKGKYRALYDATTVGALKITRDGPI